MSSILDIRRINSPKIEKMVFLLHMNIEKPLDGPKYKFNHMFEVHIRMKNQAQFRFK